MRHVLLRAGEDGWWVAEVPSLPGTVSQGKTREEAIMNVREAIVLMEEVLTEHGEPVPQDDLDATLVVV
jgi:predicted RNase H-like HicB family nuclease